METASEQAKHLVAKIQAQIRDRQAHDKKLLTLIGDVTTLTAQDAGPKKIREVSKALSKLNSEWALTEQAELNQKIEEIAETKEETFLKVFTKQVSDFSTNAKLEFKISNPKAWMVGAYKFEIDLNKESGKLLWGTYPIVSDIALNIEAFEDSFKKAQTIVFDDLENLDLGTFASVLRDAVTVVAMRSKSPKENSKIVVSLPAVHQEMMKAKVVSDPISGTIKAPAYPAPRFIVELKKFLQSELNIENERAQFSIQPAVIENSKNSQKSYFVPQQITNGAGEGSYIQSIILKFIENKEN